VTGESRNDDTTTTIIAICLVGILIVISFVRVGGFPGSAALFW